MRPSRQWQRQYYRNCRSLITSAKTDEITEIQRLKE